MDSAELVPGTVFADRFIVERVSGKGGMGIVYRARDRKRNGATVALKVLRAFAHRRHFRERFCREAYMLSELRHPGIVSYVDHGIVSGGHAFLAMEWLDGEDLDERLDRCGLTLLETVDMFRGIADALSAAHRRGFVHRDLKPENIFLRHGHPALPTLLDFGVARLMASELTGSGHAVGTPIYMAPEQARGERNIGPSADVFALGCVMYTCLTGLTPLAAGQATVVLPSMLLDDVLNLHAVRPDMPEKLDLLLQRMLARDPAERPRDASALLEELNALGPLEERRPEASRPACASSSRSRASRDPLSSEDTEAMQLASVILVAEERATSHEQRRALGDALRDRFDARIEAVTGASMLVTLAQTERMTATDQCVQAARCALFLRGRFASGRIVITTAPSFVMRQHTPGEDVLDRASALLRQEPGVYLDAMTAHLLDARFQMRQAPSGFFVLDSELAVEQAAGNVLFLEELIRFVAENQSDELPDTVVAILQARLQHLEPELRRVLRAASVYGGTFWRGGVLALMRPCMPASRVDKHLEELTRRELITKNGTSRLLGDTEYTFRHALVREAAHGLLTDQGRKTGHRAAAEFLQSTGEHDPHVLAEHYALGGELDRAKVFYARAAAQALDHANLREVSRLAEQGIACGATGELRGSLRSVQARALLLDCDYRKGYELVSEALPLLHPGSVDWCHAVGTMVVAMLSSLDRYDEALAWGEVLRATDPEPDAVGAYVESLRSLVGMLTLSWQREQVQTYLARMDAIVETSDSLSVRGSWEFSHAHAGWYLSRNPWLVSMAAARAETSFETVNHRRHLTKARIYRGASLAHLGNVDAGEEKLRAARAEALRDGDKFTNGLATLHLAMALADKDDAAALEEAEPMLRGYLEHPGKGDDNLQAFAHAILGRVFLGRGVLDRAECHLGRALEGLVDFVAMRPYADAAWVHVLLRRGRNAEARDHANAALIRCDRLGGGGFAEVRLQLAAFEAYAAARDRAAERILERAIEQIGIRADAIGDASARMRFLTMNPIHRRALEVAHSEGHVALRATELA